LELKKARITAEYRGPRRSGWSEPSFLGPGLGEAETPGADQQRLTTHSRGIPPPRFCGFESAAAPLLPRRIGARRSSNPDDPCSPTRSGGMLRRVRILPPCCPGPPSQRLSLARHRFCSAASPEEAITTQLHHMGFDRPLASLRAGHRTPAFRRSDREQLPGPRGGRWDTGMIRLALPRARRDSATGLRQLLPRLRSLPTPPRAASTPPGPRCQSPSSFFSPVFYEEIPVPSPAAAWSNLNLAALVEQTAKVRPGGIFLCHRLLNQNPEPAPERAEPLNGADDETASHSESFQPRPIDLPRPQTALDQEWGGDRARLRWEPALGPA